MDEKSPNNFELNESGVKNAKTPPSKTLASKLLSFWCTKKKADASGTEAKSASTTKDSKEPSSSVSDTKISTPIASELDNKIEAIQRSTKTMFRFFSSPHNKLRMKYGWYYKWHLSSRSRIVHWAVLAGFALVCALMVINIINTKLPGASAADIPTVNTTQAVGIQSSSVIGAGEISNTGGGKATVRGFKVGLSKENVWTVSEYGSFDKGNFSLTIKNLSPSSTYYYRAFASNSKGTGYGPWQTFMTKVGLPSETSLTTNAASNITANQATANGEVAKGENITTRGFKFGLAKADTGSVSEDGEFSTGKYSLNITGLQANTTYYYRAFAIDKDGTSYGEWLSFTTIADGSTSSTPADDGNIVTTSNPSSTESNGSTPSGSGSNTVVIRDNSGSQTSGTSSQQGANLRSNFSITASAGNNGSITPSNTFTVNRSADQTFTVSPTTGFYVADVIVDGASQGAITTYTFKNVLADHTIQAIFGNAQFNAPSNLSLTNISSDSMSVTLTDNSFNEDGFKVWISSASAVNCADANYSAEATFAMSANTTEKTVTGLTPNAGYCAKAIAYKGTTTSAPIYSNQKYTLAARPGVPTLTTSSVASIKINLDVNGNSSSTRYAIWNESLQKYVKHSNGATSDQADWQTFADWGGNAGFLNVNLSQNSFYAYKVKAINQDGVETIYSGLSSVYTFNPGITVSGKAYADKEKTDVLENVTIALTVNGGIAYQAETNAGGEFIFSSIGVAPNDAIALYISGETGVKGSTLTQAIDDGTNLLGLEIYKGRITVANTTSKPIDKDTFAKAKKVGESDIIWEISVSGDIVFPDESDLFVPIGKTFASEGTMTAKNVDVDGYMLVKDGAVLNVKGDFDASAGVFQANNSTVNFEPTAGTTTEIKPGLSEFKNVNITADASATVKVASDMFVNGEFKMSSGKLDLSNNPTVTLNSNINITGGEVISGDAPVIIGGGAVYKVADGINLGNLVFDSTSNPIVKESKQNWFTRLFGIQDAKAEDVVYSSTTNLDSDLYADSITVNSGVDLYTNGYDLHVGEYGGSGNITIANTAEIYLNDGDGSYNTNTSDYTNLYVYGDIAQHDGVMYGYLNEQNYHSTVYFQKSGTQSLDYIGSFYNMYVNGGTTVEASNHSVANNLDNFGTITGFGTTAVLNNYGNVIVRTSYTITTLNDYGTFTWIGDGDNAADTITIPTTGRTYNLLVINSTDSQDIYQNNNTLNATSLDVISGTLNARTYAVNVTSSYSQSGGTFKAPSNTFTYGSASGSIMGFAINGGTFDTTTNAGGTVKFQATNWDNYNSYNVTTNNTSFNNVIFDTEVDNTNPSTIAVDDITVNGTMTVQNSHDTDLGFPKFTVTGQQVGGSRNAIWTLNGGLSMPETAGKVGPVDIAWSNLDIHLKGNLTIADPAATCNANIIFNKQDGDQSVSITAGTFNGSATIDNTASYKTVFSGLSIFGTLILTSGTADFSTNTSSVDFSSGMGVTITDGTLLVPDSGYTYTFGQINVNGGTFDAKGNAVVVTSQYYQSGGTFKAPSGTMTLGNGSGFSGFTVYGGGFDTTTNAGGTVVFLSNPYSSDYNVVTANTTFNNVTFDNTANYNAGTISVDDMTVSGTLTAKNSTLGESNPQPFLIQGIYNSGESRNALWTLNGSLSMPNVGAVVGYTTISSNNLDINLKGDLTVADAQATLGANITFTGTTATQNIALSNGGTFSGNVTVNKASGTVTNNSGAALSLGTLNITNGTFTNGNYDLTVYDLNYGTSETNPTMNNIGNLTVNGTYTQYSTVGWTANYTSGKTFNFGTFALNAGTFDAEGNTMNVTNYFSLSSGTFKAPSGTFTFGDASSVSPWGFSISGGTFNTTDNDGGTIVFEPGYNSATYTITTNNVNFNNVTFSVPTDAYNPGNTTISGNFNVNGDLAFQNDNDSYSWTVEGAQDGFTWQYPTVTVLGDINAPEMNKMGNLTFGSNEWSPTFAAINLSGSDNSTDENVYIYPVLTPVGPTISVSGTGYEGISGTIKVAINGSLTGQTASAGTTWTISGLSEPESGQTVIVFLDGAADANESTAITKYDGTGDITGLALTQATLNIGSADNQSIANSDFGYDGVDDEDMLATLSGSDLTVAGNLTILASNTYAPGGNTTVAGAWTNNGTFTAGSGTVNLTGTSTANISSNSQSFNNLTINGISWASDYASWSYSKAVTLSNPTSSTLTNYPTKVVVDTATLVSAGKMQSNCSDIRFATTNGSAVGYYVGSGCNTSTTELWVRPSSISANSTTQVMMYYGKSGVTTTGDITMFPLWDSGELGDLSQWDSVTSFALATDQSVSASSSIKSTTNPSNMFKYFDIASGQLEFDLRFGDNTNTTYPLFLTDNANGSLYWMVAYNGHMDWYDGTYHQYATYSANTWYNIKVAWDYSQDKFWIWIDDVLKVDGAPCHDNTGTTHTSITSFHPYNYLTSGMWLDNVVIKSAYASVEPTYSFGSEISGASPASYSMSDTLDVNGNLTITAGTLNANGQNIEVGGNFSNSGTFTAGSGTVTFDAGDTGNTIAAGGSAYNNVTFNNAAGGWDFSSDEDLTVSGTFTVTNSETSGNGVNLNNNDNVILNGNVVLNGGKLTSGSSVIHAKGDWTKGSGSFVAGSGTVYLDKTSGTQAVSGNNIFNNLNTTTTAARTISFAGDSTQSVTGTWTVGGASGQLLTLQSADTRYFTMSLGSVPTVSYVTVSYMTTSGDGASFCATYSTGSNYSGFNVSDTDTCQGGGTVPADASGVTIGTIAATTFTVTWTDNSSDETGFKVWLSSTNIGSCATATYGESADYTPAEDAESQNVTSKTPDTQYCAKVVATNATGDSDPAYTTSASRTLAATPSISTAVANSWDETNGNAITLAIGQNSNPSSVSYAIKVVYGATTKWLAANNTLGDSEVWGSYTTWGGDTVLVKSLSADTSYALSIKAKNSDAAETSLAAYAGEIVSAPAQISFATPNHTANTTSSITWSWEVYGGPALTEFRLFNSTNDLLVGTAADLATTLNEGSLASANTQYSRYIRANRDGVLGQPSSTASAYTSIETPTGITYGTIANNSIAISASGSFTNLASGGLYFVETTELNNGGGTGFGAWTTTNSLTDSGLSTNVQYGYQVRAKNGDGDLTDFTSNSNKYTLANAANQPTVDNPTSSSLTITIPDTDSNPAGTEYAIKNTTASNQFVQADGSLGASAVWQTKATWGSVANTGLSASTEYTYAVYARNGDNTETSASTTNSGTTSAEPGTAITISGTAYSSYGGATLNNVTINAVRSGSFGQTNTNNSDGTFDIEVDSPQAGEVVGISFNSDLYSGNALVKIKDNVTNIDGVKLYADGGFTVENADDTSPVTNSDFDSLKTSISNVGPVSAGAVSLTKFGSFTTATGVSTTVDMSGRKIIVGNNKKYQPAGNVTAKSIILESGSSLQPASDSTIEITDTTFDISSGTYNGSGADHTVQFNKLSGDITVKRGSNNLKNVLVSSGTVTPDASGLVITGDTTMEGGALSTANGGVTFSGTNQAIAFNAGAISGANSLTFAGDGSTLSSSVAFNAPVIFGSTPETITLTSDTTYLQGVSVAAGGDQLNTDGYEMTVTGNVTVGSESTLNASDGTDGASTITMTGNFVNNGTFTKGSSVVIFNGTDTQTISTNGSSFNTIRKSTGGTLELSSATTTTNLTIDASTTVDVNGQDLTVTTLSNDGTLKREGHSEETLSITNMDADSGTVEYYGSTNGTIQNFAASNDYNNLKVNGTATWGVDADLDVNGNLDITAGTLSLASTAHNITLGGNMAIGASGIFTKGTGTITFDGSSTQTLTDSRASVGDLGAVAINGSTNTLSLSTDAKVTSMNVAIGSTLEMNDKALTITGSGSGVSRPFIVNGSLAEETGTIIHNTASATTVEDETYYNLTLTGGATFTASGTTAISNTFTVETGTTFDASSATINLSGGGTPFALNGALTASTSTFRYLASSNITAASYNNLQILPSSGTGTMNSGTFNIAGTLTIGGTVTANTNDPVINTVGLTIQQDKTFNASDAAALSISGAFSNSGTFAANSGTVNFTGSASITGTTEFATANFAGTSHTINTSCTFANFVSQNPSGSRAITFSAGTTTTVTTLLDIDGESGTLINLQSSSSGSQWNLTPPSSYDSSTPTVSYVNVSDSVNTSNTIINPPYSTVVRSVNWLPTVLPNNASDTMERLAVSVSSNHLISFTNRGSIPAHATLTVSLPGGENAFVNPGGMDYTDVDVAIGEEDVDVAATQSGDSWGVSFTGTVLTLTVGDTAVPDANTVNIEIGDNATYGSFIGDVKLRNPNVPGNFKITIVSNGITYPLSVAILSKDDIDITGMVNPTISFEIDGPTAISFGDLTTVATKYADGDGGKSVSTAAHTLKAQTNGTGGYSLSVKGDSLKHRNTQRKLTPIGETYDISRQDQEQFGIRFNRGGANTGLVRSRYGTTDRFAFVETSLGDIIAEVDGATNQNTYEAYYVANIGGRTDAGDYETTLTYILVGKF